MLLAESLLATNAAVAANFIEDVFSTYLYTGTGSAQTITNGVDLAGKGGLVWMKGRSGATDHALYDTARGATFDLASNTTAAQTTQATGLTTFGSTGFSIGALAKINTNAATYASWTFRKQAKFFDIQTWTSANSATARTITHNLGSTPGCVIIKCLGTHSSSLNEWYTVHRYDITAQGYLNQTFAFAPGVPVVTAWTDTTVTFASDFNTGTNNYVVYLFAHNAGGFGATGADNVISCGSFTKSASVEATITLGYEPQWLLFKRTDAAENWFMIDNMRSMTVGSTDAYLIPNLSSAESNLDFVTPTPTGFVATNNFNTGTYIYIAIRRGPMKTPTTGTSVFSPIASSAATGTTLTTSFPVDAQIFSLRTGTTNKNNTYDRLRGVSSTTTESGARLITSSTAAETAAGNETRLWNNTSFQMPSTFGGASTVFWNFRRAPGFFDVVCYTGTGSAVAKNHNLAAIPQMIILKKRGTDDGSVGTNWGVYVSLLGSGNLFLNATNAYDATGYMSMSATSTTFTDTKLNWDVVSQNYVAYLFATVAGVSKVGSYTGTGTTKQIDCGFTGGARFVLIKRTDSTGDWYVWDSARGIVAGNDPYLLLNSTAAEDTSTDYIDTYSAGFELSSTAPTELNANGGTYIFLAIA